MSWLYKLATSLNFQPYIKKINKQKVAESYEMGRENAIELFDISVKYQTNTVIDNFNYKFKKNRTYSIIGPSGSGKSVLSDHFNGISKCKTGNIYLFNGIKILYFKKKIADYRKLRKTVGMVLQFPEYQLFKETVLEDVCYGPKMLGMRPEEYVEKAKSKLIELGIGKQFFKSNPLMLSGGQKRKVALAGILVIDPEIIIFDEPTIGLDPFSESKIIEMISDLKKQNKTIVIITHNMDLVLQLSDELLVIENGKLVDHGEPYLIFKNSLLNIGRPKIIKFIENLNKKNSRFYKLWIDKPKCIKALAKSISNVIYQ